MEKEEEKRQIVSKTMETLFSDMGGEGMRDKVGEGGRRGGVAGRRGGLRRGGVVGERNKGEEGKVHFREALR